MAKLHAHAGGALPTRHQVTFGLLRGVVSPHVMELHGGQRGIAESSTRGSGCAMSFVRWSQAVRISFVYRVKMSKNYRTTPVELIYGLRFFAPAAKCCM